MNGTPGTNPPQVNLPRVELAFLPTPLEEAPNLSRALGGPRILLKRDDNTGLALGGNKVRRLEYFFAEALALGADTILTTGALQSNHVRMTAAAARKAGLDVVLVIAGERPARPAGGNLFLDMLFGAELVFSGAGRSASTTEIMHETARELEAKGRRPYIIPFGGSGGVGDVGYVECVCELESQLRAMGARMDRLFVACGSGGTQAGLELGARLLGSRVRITGVATSGNTREKQTRTAELVNAAAKRLGSDIAVTPGEIEVLDQYLGDGYGLPTPGGMEAIKLLARTEGVLLDPVYTGKVMAGLIDQVRRGAITPDETVVFLHTGGLPGLFTRP